MCIYIYNPSISLYHFCNLAYMRSRFYACITVRISPKKITIIFLPLTNCREVWGVLELWQNVARLRIAVNCLLFGAPNRHDLLILCTCVWTPLFGNMRKHDGDFGVMLCMWFAAIETLVWTVGNETGSHTRFIHGFHTCFQKFAY